LAAAVLVELQTVLQTMEIQEQILFFQPSLLLVVAVVAGMLTSMVKMAVLVVALVLLEMQVTETRRQLLHLRVTTVVTM
jgi:hypothetical protein